MKNQEEEFTSMLQSMMSLDDIMKILHEMEDRVRKIGLFSNDGSIKVWEKEFIYQNVKYILQLHRSYTLFTPLEKLVMWFELNNPDSQEKDAEIYKEVFGEEFLNEGTYHIDQVDMPLKEMFYSIVCIAEEQIEEYNKFAISFSKI